jgi:hypothetical protein
MSVQQIIGLIMAVIEQLGLLPYIQAGMLVVVAVAVVAAARRSFGNGG